MPSPKKKKSAPTASHNLRSQVDSSPSGGDKSRDSVSPPVARESSNLDGSDVFPPQDPQGNPLSSLQRGAPSGDSGSEDGEIQFGLSDKEEAAEECLAAIEAAHPEFCLDDEMRSEFKSMYLYLVKQGYDDSALIGVIKMISEGAMPDFLREKLVKLFPPPKSVEVNSQNETAVTGIKNSFAKIQVDEAKLNAKLRPHIVGKKTRQGFSKAADSALHELAEPLIQAGILTARLPTISQMQDLTPMGMAVSILGKSILPESQYAFEQKPVGDINGSVKMCASVKERVQATRNGPNPSEDHKSKIARTTGNSRPREYFTESSEPVAEYLETLAQFVQNHKDRIPIPFEFRIAMATLNEFSKLLLKFLRAMIKCVDFLFIGVGEYMDDAVQELQNVLRHPNSYGSFVEYRVVSEYNFCFVHLLPDLVDHMVNVMQTSEETSYVLPNACDPIAQIYGFKFKESMDLYTQLVDILRLIYEARKYVSLRSAKEHPALCDIWMLHLLESIFNGLNYSNPNNRQAQQEILRLLLSGEIENLVDLSSKVGRLTQDGSLTPESSKAPRALVATGQAAVVDVPQQHSIKKKPCFKFRDSGYCELGDSCDYSHDLASVKSTVKSSSQVPAAPAPDAGQQLIKTDSYKKHFEDTKFLYQLYKGLIEHGLTTTKIGNIFRRVQISVNGEILEGITLMRDPTDDSRPVFVPGMTFLQTYEVFIRKIFAALTIRGNGSLPLLCTKDLKDIGHPSTNDPKFASVAPPPQLFKRHPPPPHSNFKSSGSAGVSDQGAPRKFSHSGNQGVSGGGGRPRSGNHHGNTFAARQPQHSDDFGGGSNDYYEDEFTRPQRDYSPSRDNASRAAMNMTVSSYPNPRQHSHGFFGRQGSQPAEYPRGIQNHYGQRDQLYSRDMHASRGGAMGRNSDTRNRGDQQYAADGGYSRRSNYRRHGNN